MNLALRKLSLHARRDAANISLSDITHHLTRVIHRHRKRPSPAPSEPEMGSVMSVHPREPTIGETARFQLKAT